MDISKGDEVRSSMFSRSAIPRAIG